MKHRGIVANPPGGLILAGPLVEVRITPTAQAAQAQVASGHTPKGAIIKMMVDTGAERTVVEDQLARSIGLIPIRYVPISGVDQKPVKRPVYRMNINIGMDDNGKHAETVYIADVVGVPSCPREHSGLIGRDFLSHVHFSYNGPKGTFEIEPVHFTAPPQGAQPQLSTKTVVDKPKRATRKPDQKAAAKQREKAKKKRKQARKSRKGKKK